jgi:multicomponent Na+:H+ antiporter subunit E
VRYLLGLLVGLAILWLVLSGHYAPMFLAFGLGSCLFTVWLCHRLGSIDAEGVPVDLLPRLPGYMLWLLWQILKANVDVAARILRPGRHISPTMITLTAHQRTPLGQAVFANSVTLTPGTITVGLTDGQAEVHALSEAGSHDLDGGVIDQRVRALESRVRHLSSAGS